MARTAVLGLPRMGPNRELKFALESYWAGTTPETELRDVAASLRRRNWTQAQSAGIDVIPSGDLSLYDHILDTIWAFGAIPERFGAIDRGSLSDYFVLARGDATRRPLEMTKWFDTNYHYLVPELAAGQTFELRTDHWTGPMDEARALGIATRPVVVGPITFLLLSKGVDDPLTLLDALVPEYVHLVAELAAKGATEIQLDEPVIALDRTPDELAAFVDAFTAIREASPVPVTLTTYFAGLTLDGTLESVAKAAPDELHVDLIRSPEQIGAVLTTFADTPTRLSLGVIDGRNVWATDLDAALGVIDTAVAAVGGDRVTIAPSCSLLHLPVTLEGEDRLDPEVRSWLAFADERLTELTLLGELAEADAGTRDVRLADSRAVQESRRTSKTTNDTAVDARTAALRPDDYSRSAPAPERRVIQRERIALPDYPTTTIGSYPQTPEIRKTRRDFATGAIDRAEYERFMTDEIATVIAFQEEIGLDVLVHGEPERNDMVEYFGEQLAGFAFTANGWVQSYGSRCVKPPIIFGDVSRPTPMTVQWWQAAQNLTDRPVKGMLTGPVTILQWSFVRNDQPREETCTQIALAIQDEVSDLEAAGCAIVQVDEAALREGLPLQIRDRDAYNRWAVDCFRLTVAAAKPETQIHTHMCYSEFNDMMEHIIRLDADVISIEASRSDMEVLDAFEGSTTYPNDIGPGVYDIHSPRVPSTDEIEALLKEAERRIDRAQLWVNPDCGLKTRRWDDVRPALTHLVEAAKRLRERVAAEA